LTNWDEVNFELDVFSKHFEADYFNLRKFKIFDEVSQVKNHFGIIELNLSFGKKTSQSIFVILKNTDDGPVNITDYLANDFTDIEFSKNAICLFQESFFEFKKFIISSFLQRGHKLSNNPEIIWHPTSPEFSLVEFSECGICTYINTDLNDFGRGFDMTESPKRFGKDSYYLLAKRLRIPSEKNKEALSKYMRAILPQWREKSLLKFHEFSDELFVEIFDGKLQKPYKPTHLSLGENETFFIFSLIIGLPVSNGIVILDEPASGLSSDSYRRFLEELYKLCETREIQLFIVSHKIDPVFEDYEGKVYELKNLSNKHTLTYVDDVAQLFAEHSDFYNKKLKVISAHKHKGDKNKAISFEKKHTKKITESNYPQILTMFYRVFGIQGGITGALGGILTVLLNHEGFSYSRPFDTFKSFSYVDGLIVIIALCMSVSAFLLMASTKRFLTTRRGIRASIFIELEKEISLNDAVIFRLKHPILSGLLESAIATRIVANKSIAKTIAFLSFHLCIAFLIAYSLTKDPWLGGKFALLEIGVNFFVFWWLEKNWDKLETWFSRKQ